MRQALGWRALVGVVVVGSTPAELATFLKAEMDKWEAGISIRE